MPKTLAEPYKIKMVEPIRLISEGERKKAMLEAGYNTFLLRSEDVFIDLLTDSGTSAMSDRQWAGMMLGDEAYAGSRNFYHLEDAIHEIYGWKYIVPTHQGRGAEHIMSQILIKKGDFVPGNMYFTTTRLHQEKAGGTFVDVIVDEAHDSQSTYQWKGNVDMAKMQKLVDEVGADRVPYISLEGCVNMAGGQPFCMDNLRELRAFCDKYKIPIMLDATRVIENAWFIQQHEDGYKNKSIKQIVREIGDLSDGCTMSSKKDHLVNIGGFLAMNDEDFFVKAKAMVVEYEGLHTYGGMAGRDMEAVALGMREAVDTDEHVAARIRQVHYLGKKMTDAGIPCVVPFGGHAIFVDAKRFLDHLPQDHFPSQTLSAHIYMACGVRTMERGNVSAGRDPVTNDNRKPKLELVRYTIPRRVFTNLHMDVAAEGTIELFERRHEIQGLKFTYEPPVLRFFQAIFEPIPLQESKKEMERLHAVAK
jgi:tyrosine phenol-lyase